VHTGSSAGATKFIHEIRDPIHTFIRLTSDEREVLRAAPLQRLRYIHQLATTYLVYPGATHRRFEHSLGVMEVATRIFDRIIQAERDSPVCGAALTGIRDDTVVGYWRNVLRMAALCHDIGHLPFSHAAEGDLLPEGVDHETITRALIESEPLSSLLAGVSPPLRMEDVTWVALGAKKMAGTSASSAWVEVLAEILTGDVFGADRIDYLLRDAYHAGVAYGRFDHYRLIDTLRVLPLMVDGEQSDTIAIGVEEGGLQSAEALLLARYFMFTQVYFHPVRRAYDIHLKDFLTAWLPNGRFSADPAEHLRQTDDEVIVAMRRAASNPDEPGHDAARRFMQREHFRLLYEPDPADLALVVSPGEAIAEAASAEVEIGPDSIRYDAVLGKAGASPDFSVLRRNGELVAGVSLSRVIPTVPAAAVEFVFVAPEKLDAAQTWLDASKAAVLGRVAATPPPAPPPPSDASGTMPP
jgi:uncharacterized protein